MRMLDPALSLLIALCGALLFGAAAIHKVRARDSFAATLAAYRILPVASASVAAATICLLEFAAAAALLWPATRPIGAAMGVALLVGYAAAIAVNLIRGRRDLDCGCGPRAATIAGWMVTRNVSLAAVLALLTLPTSPRLLGLADYATVAGGIIVITFLYLSVETLFARPTIAVHAGEHP